MSYVAFQFGGSMSSQLQAGASATALNMGMKIDILTLFLSQNTTAFHSQLAISSIKYKGILKPLQL
ncbi:MAG: hypothetical protein ACJAVV_001955 [Alphaproteobacteria bacterium]|jgi:hypothetical protein